MQSWRSAFCTYPIEFCLRSQHYGCSRSFLSNISNRWHRKPVRFHKSSARPRCCRISSIYHMTCGGGRIQNRQDIWSFLVLVLQQKKMVILFDTTDRSKQGVLRNSENSRKKGHTSFVFKTWAYVYSPSKLVKNNSLIYLW